MYQPFDQLPGHSRIWVYPSDRPLTVGEQEEASRSLEEFCSGWAAHGHPLRTSFRILNDHFIILAADEQAAGASGCSIDSSVRHLKQLGSQLGIDFFNRGQVPFFKEGRVSLVPVNGLKEAFQSGALAADTITFNTLAASAAELETDWMVPAGRSWLARYLPAYKAV